MVIGAVVALWAATLAAADENCLLQTFPPTQELQVEESTMADLVLDQPIACPEGFADFSYNWTGVAGFPNGGPLSNGQEIGPNIELVGFNETMGGPCIGGAIWNITNNDPASPGADTDLQTCPNNNVASAPFCNILVVQQDGSAAGKVNDCNPGGGFAQINLQFTVPITLIALNFWDIEQNDDLQIFWNSDGTPGNAFAPGTGGVDGTGSELFLNKEKVYVSPALELSDFSQEQLRFNPELPREIPLAVRLVLDCEATAAEGENDEALEERSVHYTYISLQKANALDSPKAEEVDERPPWSAHVIGQKLEHSGQCFILHEVFGAGPTGDRSETNAPRQSLAHELEGNTDCVICLSEPRDTAVLPCRHMCFCSYCAGIVRLQCDRCPVCRQKVQSLLQFKREEFQPPETPKPEAPICAH